MHWSTGSGSDPNFGAVEFITFLLAPIGYAGLMAAAVLAVNKRPSPLWLGATVAIIVVHVFLVWHVRYEWQFSEATRNGYTGFALFQGALAAIVLSTAVPAHITRVLLTIAFLVVTVGALAATAEYDVVRAYRIPVIIIAAVGLIGLISPPAWALVKRYRGLRVPAP
jgi:hypothetical protein